MDDVVVRGERAVTEEDIEEKLATRASPKFLGVFRGVYDYAVLDRMVLARDLQRVERHYRARGYYEAHARAGRIVPTKDRHVRVEIVVEEGEPVLVRTVAIGGLEALPRNVAEAARDAVDERLAVHEPFVEEAFERSEGAIRRALTDRGYAYAKVTRDAAVDLVRRSADVVFTVEPGPPCEIGEITIEGLGEIPESAVRRALDLSPGDPYSTETLAEAHDALLDLGVLGSVEIEPRLENGPTPDRRVPVIVRVRPTHLRAVSLGGGIELDTLRTDVHGLAGWRSSSFLGGLRRLEVQLRPGVVIVPTRADNLVVPERALFEGRLRLELRQPGLVEARTGLFFRHELSMMPVLLRSDTDSDDPILGYREIRATGGADRRVGRVYASLSHNVQVEDPFAYVGEADPTLELLVLSYPELVVQIDLRDDRVDPSRGLLVASTFQIAGGPFGGDAADVRIQPEVRGYVPLGSDITLAARAAVGFLFPFSYGDRIAGGGAEKDRIRDLQIVYFRGLFSGGPTSNRGYPLRSVGPHGFVPFLLDPTRGSRQCDGDEGARDPARCAIPVGGTSLWEASLEVRADLARPLSAALFCDASDVSPNQLDLRLDYPHLSCGTGIRYKTPIGAVRLDVGYRIPGLQVPRGADPMQTGEPSEIFGLPLAIAFGVGEAF